MFALFNISGSEMAASLVVPVNLHFSRGPTNFIYKNVNHFIDKILNIYLIKYYLMNLFCLFLVFYIDNSEQRLRTWIKNSQLGFGLLMNSWVVSHFLLIH